MVVAEAPPWVQLAIVAIVLALASRTLLASRRQGAPWLSWLAFGFVVAIVVFVLGIVGISWAAAFFAIAR